MGVAVVVAVAAGGTDDDDDCPCRRSPSRQCFLFSSVQTARKLRSRAIRAKEKRYIPRSDPIAGVEDGDDFPPRLNLRPREMASIDSERGLRSLLLLLEYGPAAAPRAR